MIIGIFINNLTFTECITLEELESMYPMDSFERNKKISKLQKKLPQCTKEELTIIAQVLYANSKTAIVKFKALTEEEYNRIKE